MQRDRRTFNQVIIRLLQYLQTQEKWTSSLPQIQAILNAHPISVTKISATQTVFGYQPRLHSVPASPASTVTPRSDDPHPTRHHDLVATRWTTIDDQMRHQQQHQLYQSYCRSDLSVGSQMLIFDNQRAQAHTATNSPRNSKDHTPSKTNFLHNFTILCLLRLKPFLAHRDHLCRFLSGSSAGKRLSW